MSWLHCASALFRDRPARNAVASVAGGIAHQVVRFSVDHQSRAAVGEHGIASGAQGNGRIFHRELRSTVRFHSEIRQIARVRFGARRVVNAVVGVGWVEVRSDGSVNETQQYRTGFGSPPSTEAAELYSGTQELPESICQLN